jgi:uncharacterized lipoprotein
MKVFKCLPVFLLIIQFFGCVSRASLGDWAGRLQRTGPQQQQQSDRTWSAVVETFAELNLPIMKAEKSSGLIATDWISFKDRIQGTTYCSCGSTILPLSEVDRRGKIDVVVTDMEIKVNAVFEKISQYKEIVDSSPCVSTGKLEAEIRKRVSEKTGANAGSWNY